MSGYRQQNSSDTASVLNIFRFIHSYH